MAFSTEELLSLNLKQADKKKNERLFPHPGRQKNAKDIAFRVWTAQCEKIANEHFKPLFPEIAENLKRRPVKFDRIRATILISVSGHFEQLVAWIDPPLSPWTKNAFISQIEEFCEHFPAVIDLAPEYRQFHIDLTYRWD